MHTWMRIGEETFDISPWLWLIESALDLICQDAGTERSGETDVTCDVFMLDRILKECQNSYEIERDKKGTVRIYTDRYSLIFEPVDGNIYEVYKTLY